MKRPREIEDDSSIGDVDLVKSCVLEFLQEEDESELKTLLDWAENEDWELEGNLGSIKEEFLKEELGMEKSESESSIDEYELEKS